MTVLKWTAVFIIVIGALGLTGAMLHSMDIVDMGELTLNTLQAVPAFQDPVRTYRLGLHAEAVITEERRNTEALRGEIDDLRRQMENEYARFDEIEEQLQRRTVRLDQRERQLEAQAQRLQDQLQNLQDLERLQFIYSSMRPRELAPILEEMEDAIVALLLAGMQERHVAAVLAEIEPIRAAKLSKMVGGISTK